MSFTVMRIIRFSLTIQIEGAVFALFSYARPEEVNLSSVYYLISKGEERFGGSTFLKEFVEMEENNENVSCEISTPAKSS